MSTHRTLSDGDRRWLNVLSVLNEAQARLFVAERALALGRGGISQMAQLTGMSRPTIMKGAAELQGAPLPVLLAQGRIRKEGGGRRSVEAVEPAIVRELTLILGETTAGDPMSLLKWTSKSTRAIAEELTRKGHPMSSVTVARCLRDLGYSLQANVKAIEGPQHVDRDAQFRHINAKVRSFIASGDPVISVDTKKKELVGGFRNAGKTWKRRGEAERVLVHNFPHLGEGKAIPFGTYDLAQDQGWVNVGVSHDTAEFAIESIRRWWRRMGSKVYAHPSRWLICADAGGSNGPRLRLWKVCLQRIADELGIPITVCHYPPGTSKWNAIEHRLFSFISIHWRGQPLTSYETVVNLIGHTRTRTGLKVKAALDPRQYEAGRQVTQQEFEAVRVRGHKFHPDWNYTVSPNSERKQT